MIKFISWLGCLLAVNAWAAPQTVRPPSLPIINVMTNGSFEAGKAAWTASSPSTFTISTSTPLNGGGSGVFTATGSSQTVTSAQYPIPEGLKGGNCAASLIFESPEPTSPYFVQIIDGSSNILAGPVRAAKTSQTLPQSLTFQCPTSGTMALQVLSSGSALGFKWDDVTLGSNKLIQVSQANLYGGVTISGCSTAWTTTAGSSSAFSPVTGCVYTPFGAASAPATNVPGLSFASLPPGEYVVDYDGLFESGTAAAAVTAQLTDGVNFSRESPAFYGGGSTVFLPELNFSINYATAQNNPTTLQMYGSTGGGSTFSAAVSTIRVYRFPLQSEMAVKPETINWVLDALSNNGGPLDLGTGTTSMPTDIQSAALNVTNSGTMTALQPCTVGAATGSVCGAGVGSLGVAFNLPASQDVLACAQLSHHLTTSATDTPQTAFAIYETDQNNTMQFQGGSYAPQDAITAGSSAIGLEAPFNLCERLHFTSAGLKYVRLNFGQVSGGGIAVSELLSSPPVHWIIKPITQNVPAPVLVGGLISSSAGVEDIERAQVSSICTSDPCGITTGTPGITAINRTSAGIYVAHFAVGTFSSNAACTVRPITATASAPVFEGGSGTASTNLASTMKWVDVTNTATDAAFEMICMGQH